MMRVHEGEGRDELLVAEDLHAVATALDQARRSANVASSLQ